MTREEENDLILSHVTEEQRLKSLVYALKKKLEGMVSEKFDVNSFFKNNFQGEDYETVIMNYLAFKNGSVSFLSMSANDDIANNIEMYHGYDFSKWPEGRKLLDEVLEVARLHVNRKSKPFKVASVNDFMDCDHGIYKIIRNNVQAKFCGYGEFFKGLKRKNEGDHNAVNMWFQGYSMSQFTLELVCKINDATPRFFTDRSKGGFIHYIPAGVYEVFGDDFKEEVVLQKNLYSDKENPTNFLFERGEVSKCNNRYHKKIQEFRFIRNPSLVGEIK